MTQKVWRKNLLKGCRSKGTSQLEKLKKLIIRREHSIPYLRKKIERCRRNCIQCLLAAKKQERQEGYLYPIPKEDRPLQTYHLDHVRPPTTAGKHYKYIPVIVDGFSKFVWIYPTKTLSTFEVLQKLSLQSVLFGNPQRVITDRGSAFTAYNFDEYCH